MVTLSKARTPSRVSYVTLWGGVGLLIKFFVSPRWSEGLFFISQSEVEVRGKLRQLGGLCLVPLMLLNFIWACTLAHMKRVYRKEMNEAIE